METENRVLELLKQEIDYMYNINNEYDIEERIKETVNINNKILNLLYNSKYVVLHIPNSGVREVYKKLLQGLFESKNINFLNIKEENNQIIIDNTLVPSANQEQSKGIFDKRWKYYMEGLKLFQKMDRDSKLNLFKTITLMSMEQRAVLFMTISSSEDIKLQVAYSEKDLYSKDILLVLPIGTIVKSGWIINKKISWRELLGKPLPDTFINTIRNTKNKSFNSIINGNIGFYYLLTMKEKENINSLFMKGIGVRFDTLISEAFARKKFDLIDKKIAKSFIEHVKNLAPPSYKHTIKEL